MDQHFNFTDMIGADPTPSNINYGIHSPKDGRPVHPSSAMWATDLGHGPSWSPINPVQVSMLHQG
jgi:hypothetical protein